MHTKRRNQDPTKVWWMFFVESDPSYIQDANRYETSWLVARQRKVPAIEPT